MSKTEKSRSPFAHPWRWEQFRTTATGEFQVARVLEPEHRVIRRVPLYLLDADHRRQVDHAVAAFTAFGRYPGLYVPRFHIIRAELEPGDDRPNFRPYVFIVDRVDGETLSAKTFRRRERQEAQQYLSAFLHALTLFAGATWRRGSWYPADQTPMQYVYGSDAMGRRGVFFVDLDLNAGKIGRVDVANRHAPANSVFLRFMVGFIVMRIMDFEERIKFPFPQARQEVDALLEQMVRDGARSDLVTNLRADLRATR